MKLRAQSGILPDYLEKTPVIDFDHPVIVALSEWLKRSSTSELELVKRIYEFVRDEISHSADIAGKTVTCKASDVLMAKEGICYAKSHLLAALYRANGIPAGFCYQVLRLDDTDSPLVLHGLNGVYLGGLQKWIRLDARGNKPGVNAQFDADREILAFPVRPELGETEYAEIFTEPDQRVIEILSQCKSVEELWSNLPGKFSVTR